MALVGTGNISLMHVLGYKNFPDAEIRALCDLNEGRATAFREEAKLPASVKIYTSSAECFRDETIDLVEILTPHKSHEALAVAVAEAGKHVSVQKPPAMSLSSYDKMVRAADKAGVKFRVYENFRYHPPYVKAFDLIRDGVIGKVQSVNIRMWMSVSAPGQYRNQKIRFPLRTLLWKNKDDQNYKAPTLFDDGYHKQSLAQGFLGDITGNSRPITSVRTWTGAEKLFGVITLDSPAIVLYETAKHNCYGTWNVNTSRAIPFHSSYFACDEYLEITGSRGIIIAPGCTGNLFVGCECGGPGKPGVYWFSKDEKEKESALAPGVGTWKADCSMETDWSHSFINCTQHFASLLARDQWFDDKDPRPIRAEQGRQILAVSLAMIRSLRKDGERVRLKDVKDVP